MLPGNFPNAGVTVDEVIRQFGGFSSAMQQWQHHQGDCPACRAAALETVHAVNRLCPDGHTLYRGALHDEYPDVQWAQRPP